MNKQYIAKISKNHQAYVKAGFRNSGFVKITELTDAEMDKEFKRQKDIIKNEREILRKKQELKRMLNKLRKMRTSRKYE